MVLAGGGADKIGNRYEGRWTVLGMLDVMDEKANSIRLEKPGEDAFEFFLQRANQVECHQVKRQRTGRGQWTLKSLEDGKVKVLSDFWQILSSSTAHCVFVSTYAAAELEELATHARNSLSLQEFKREYLNKDRIVTFGTLREKWRDCTEEQAYEALKRVQVQTLSEDILVSMIENRITALVEGDPKTIRLELAELAVQKVHQELTAYDIWRYLLDERGYRRREWGKDPHILAGVKKANARYLAPLAELDSFGHTVPRDEEQIAVDRLINGKQSVLLLGAAGIGKTSVTLRVVQELHQQGLPVLAFRVDRLNPVLLPDDVGIQLGLPGSPAIVLASIAHNRDCVLVIDQIDAVSQASGRNPDFFNCVHEIIQQVQSYPNIRLLIACRKFDLDNDNRLQRLTGEKGIAESVLIQPLSHEKVRGVVSAIGLDAMRLNDKQLRLLSVPLHLTLFVKILSATPDIFTLETAKDLFEQFWKVKQQEVKKRLDRSPKWTQVIDILCDYMSDQQQQTLSAPATILDDVIDDANAMASEYVLTWENERVAFFHESFFDYAFARRFASRSQSLSSFLCKSEQHLFRRAQVRQILLHQRDTNFLKYLEDLKELLTSNDVRFHIKQIIFSVLAVLDQPTEEEWQIVAPLISGTTDALAQQVWLMLSSSVQWFHLLDSLGIVASWLNGQDRERINKTVLILSRLQSQAPERVTEIVRPQIRTTGEWLERLRNFISTTELGSNRCLFDLFLTLIQAGICDQENGDLNESRDFWLKLNSLVRHRPDWACEAVACYLRRYLNLAVEAGQPNLFDRTTGTIPRTRFGESTLLKISNAAPKEFIDHILPFIIQVLDLNANRDDNPPWNDTVWWYRPYDGGLSIGQRLFLCTRTALSHLAENDPANFAIIVDRELANSNFESIQHLLICAYAANGEHFADEAADYLCANPGRLKTGYSSGAGNVHAAPHWATRQLLQAITPFCSQERLSRIEELVLDYYPPWEKSAAYRSLRGYAQFVLLDGIESERLSKQAQRRLQEWRRKFESMKLIELRQEIQPPESIKARWVGPPISKDAVGRMTDQQWLNAVKKYKYEDARSQDAGDDLIGGAYQLAQLLQAQVKQDPLRFANLVQQFPSETTNWCYFDAVLRGVVEAATDVEAEIAISLCQYCHQIPHRACGISICWLFQKKAHLSWSTEAFEILIWYAVNDSSPERESWQPESSDDQVCYGGDPLSAGMNSVRGSAANAIASLIFHDKDRAIYFKDVLERMSQDPSIAVRTCVAEALSALLNYDRGIAIHLFTQLCQTDDRLLAAPTIEQFIYWAAPLHFIALKPILERMINSTIPEVVRIGARRSCAESLAIEEARSLGMSCLSGTPIHRQAAAEVFAGNLRVAHLREFCERSLKRLFHDEDQDVRISAAKCFFEFEEEELGSYTDLVNEFVQSPAFTDGFHDLIWALERTTAKLPEVVYVVCERYINDLMTEFLHNSQAYRTDTDSVSQLLIKVYSQNVRNQKLQSQCLDLIDRLAQIEVYGLEKALEQYER